MGRVHDRLEAVFTEIIDDPQLFLDCDCMMEIFANIESDVPPLEEHLKSMFENKSNPTISKIGTNKDQCDQAKVLGLDLLCAELFFPQCQENKDTKDLALEMAVLTSQSWLDDMRHPKKTVKHYLPSEDGENSWANASAELNARSLGSFATNDVAEQAFGKMTHMHKNST